MTKEDQIIDQALEILASRLTVKSTQITNNSDATNFLKLKLSASEREVFAVMFLDSRHQLIEYRELFFGTIDRANVYPRELVKASLLSNASAVIIAHNHPSGVAEPSRSDVALTEQLEEILKVVDVRLLDHILVAGNDSTSFAQQGLI